MKFNSPFATLQRLARPAALPGLTETCEFCAQPIAPRHRHLFETANRRVVCACDACALLFENTAGGRFQLIPRETTALPRFQMADSLWNDLALPINLVFIFAKGAGRTMTAAYPGPAGVTESLLAPENWQALVAQNPALADLKPDVEALLVNRVGPAREYFIAPIDRCFALTGLIRKHWRGLSGGEEVWREIEQFFAQLRAEAGAGPVRTQPEPIYA